MNPVITIVRTHHFSGDNRRLSGIRLNRFVGLFLGMMCLLPVKTGSQEIHASQTEEAGETLSADPAEEVVQALPLEELQVFAEVFGKIKSEYVEEIGDAELLNNAIQGMLRGLDPHSEFLAPEDFQEVRISTEGKFGGLGVEVTIEDNLIKVVAPIDDTPAQDAGLRSGDIIVRIDGEQVLGLNLADAVERMRGEPGTSTVLTIARPGIPEPFDVPLVRAVIKVVSVRGSLLEEGIGYARISSFQGGTSANLRRRIETLKQANGGRLNGLVLDLRNNPGGVLSSAVRVSDLFLETGTVVLTRIRGDVVENIYEAKPGDILEGSPIVVLLNGGSASASEIVAGALQDNQRAIIMGTRSFGKGSVQTIIPVNNGGALKLTTSRYYTPQGRSIQAQGIVPDLEVRPSELREIENRPDVREADLPGHLQQEAPAIVSPTGLEKTPTSSVDEAGGMHLMKDDYPLREAFNLLKGLNLISRKTGTSP